MNRKTMVYEMRNMLTYMSTLLDKAGIAGVLGVPEHSEKLTAAFVKGGYDWLRNIYENQYAKALEVWKLLPEALWKRYAVWGCFEDHREAIMLTNALAEMKKVIMCQGRPAFFKKAIIAKRLRSKIK